jgi:hypothetical protein
LEYRIPDNYSQKYEQGFVGTNGWKFTDVPGGRSIESIVQQFEKNMAVNELVGN